MIWNYRISLNAGNVHDGDTLTNVLVDRGFDDTSTRDIRLLNVWAPEYKEPGGIETRDYVVEWLSRYGTMQTLWNFIVITTRMKVADREQKSFDRYLGTITTLDGMRTLNADVQQFVIGQGYGPGIT